MGKSKDLLNISNIKFEASRTTSWQTLRDNVEYTSIFVPFLNSLLQQLNDCFQGKTKHAIKRMYLIPINNEKLMSEKEKSKGVLYNWSCK